MHIQTTKIITFQWQLGMVLSRWFVDEVSPKERRDALYQLVESPVHRHGAEKNNNQRNALTLTKSRSSDQSTF